MESAIHVVVCGSANLTKLIVRILELLTALMEKLTGDFSVVEASNELRVVIKLLERREVREPLEILVLYDGGSSD